RNSGERGKVSEPSQDAPVWQGHSCNRTTGKLGGRAETGSGGRRSKEGGAARSPRGNGPQCRGDARHRGVREPAQWAPFPPRGRWRGVRGWGFGPIPPAATGYSAWTEERAR